MTMNTEPAPTASPRQAEGASYQQTDAGTKFVGLVLFLGSWTVMFAALFFSFAVYRVQAPDWPPEALTGLPLWLPSLSTGLLVLASVVLESARRSALRGDFEAATRRVYATLGLAALFVVAQCWLWTQMWSGGVTLISGQFASYFYVLTVFHGLHVVIGLGLLTYLVRLFSLGDETLNRVPVRLITLFWHFVGVVWCLLFLLLFFT